MRLSGAITFTRGAATVVAAAASVGLTAPPASIAQEPTLNTVLERAAAYVTDFQRRLSGIVAEEIYVQRTNSRTAGSVLRPRELKSDVLLVRPDGAAHYVQFRDVFEVDGVAVRDRNERLSRLFLDPSQSAADQIDRITRESARYNVGEIERTINFPILPVLFLDPVYQPRFRFTRATDRVPTTMRGVRPGSDPSVASFAVSTEVWVIEYREVQRPTMIHTAGGRDLAARGRIWIEPDSGRVVMTELVAGDAYVRGVIEVSYALEPLIGLVLPVAMRDRYEDLQAATRIEGFATYSRFRRFDVQTAEQIQPLER